MVGQTVHVIAFGDAITHFSRNFASKVFDSPDHINSDTPEIIVLWIYHLLLLLRLSLTYLLELRDFCLMPLFFS